MLIAPHPDDEALACGVLLQRITRAGGAVRVLYVTDGDNNPWPQRALERKWRLSQRDRRRWGRVRRIEAIRALRLLGVPRRHTEFLQWPDQGLSELLLRECDACVEILRAAVTAWGPTLLLVPAISDTHADHNALGVMLRFAQQDLHPDLPALRVWSYSVHGRHTTFLREASAIPHTATEIATKLSAIHCHKTQIALSRRRFTAYAKRAERFRELSIREPKIETTSIVPRLEPAAAITLQLRVPFSPFPAETHLFIAAVDAVARRARCLRVQLPPRSSDVSLIDCSTGRCLATLAFRGNAFAGELTIPPSLFCRTRAFFAKLVRGRIRRSVWIEIDPSPRRAADLLPIEETRGRPTRLAAEAARSIA